MLQERHKCSCNFIRGRGITTSISGFGTCHISSCIRLLPRLICRFIWSNVLVLSFLHAEKICDTAECSGTCNTAVIQAGPLLSLSRNCQQHPCKGFLNSFRTSAKAKRACSRYLRNPKHCLVSLSKHFEAGQTLEQTNGIADEEKQGQGKMQMDAWLCGWGMREQ